MASNKVRTTSGIARIMCGAAVSAALFWAASAGLVQEPPARPMALRTREALRMAIDLYKKGDYDNASLYFAHAQTGAANLTTADQDDLKSFSTQNNNARKARQEGSVHLRQAEDALKQGKTQEAARLLSALDTNQWLSAADQQRRAELQRQLPARAASQAAPHKADAKTLLIEGRAALERKDYAVAEAFANQAEKVSSGLPAWMQPWNDSAAKLRRDVEAARAKQQPASVVRNDADSKDSRWIPNVKSWFGRADKGEKAAPDAMPVNPGAADTDAGAAKNTSTVSKFMFWPFGSAGAAKKDPAAEAMAKDEQKARQLLSDGFKAMEANRLEQAQQLAYQAKEMRVTYTSSEPTPDALLHEIQRRAASLKVRAQSNAPVANPNAPPTPDFPRPADPAPNVKPVANFTPAPTPPVPSTKIDDPRGMLKEGRALLKARSFEEADRLCARLLNAGVRWGYFEDTPEKLRRDIVKGRQGADREESVKLMVEARKLFTAGKLDDAEHKAYRAQQLHGPYSTLDFSDRPQRLLEEIHRARLNRPKDAANPAAPKEKQAAAPGSVSAGEPRSQASPTASAAPTALPAPPPAGVMNANKNRAMAIVREARELERQGLLSAALRKALEGKMLKATFLPEEDSPDRVLMSLRGKADRQIQTTLQQVPQLMTNANEPQRFNKALDQLFAARQLAMEFGLDPNPIDQQAGSLQQLAAGGGNRVDPVVMTAPVGPTPPAVTHANLQVQALDPTQQQGKEKLQHAQTELARGNYNQARKMAEELFHPSYKMQDEVLRFIRTIDAEEYNLRVLDAKRTFDAGIDAFVQKDYKRSLRIFQTIDPQLLPEQYSARLRDVMATREMQPEMVAQYLPEQIKGDKGLSASVPGITPKAMGPDAEKEDYLEHVKQLDAVQFQALRQRGREAQRTALEMFKNKQKDQAIATLKQYLEQVQLAGLAPEKSADLRREAEMRIQQFQMQMAQEKLDAAGKRTTRYGETTHDEGARNADIARRQKEVGKLIKEAGELYKQNKFEEAEVLVKQARTLEPESTAALTLAWQINIKRNQKIENNDISNNEKDFLALLRGGHGPMTSMDNPVAFDPKMVNRPRNNGAIEMRNPNPKERAIEYRLLQPLSLHFKDLPLREAIRTIAIESGVQVVPDHQALQQNGVNLDSPLSITVEDISMKSALNLLLDQLRLTYTVDNEVLMITTQDKTKGRLRQVVYPVGDLVIPPANNPMPDVFNVQKMLERNISMSGLNPYGFQSPSPYPMNAGAPAGSGSNSIGLGNQNFASHHGSGGPSGANAPLDKSPEAMAEKLKELITNTVGKNSWEQVGGQGQIQYFSNAMALVINQTQEVQGEVKDLLDSLRKLQDLQVAVELRAVLVSESFFERIGVDFNMNITTPQGRNEQALVSGNFTPFGTVNRTGAGVNAVTGLTSAGTLTPDLNIPIKNNSFQFTTPQFGNYQPDAGLSLGLAFLSDIQVFMFLEAVQGDRRAHVMQAPKITVYNGQFATILALVSRTQVSTVLPTVLPSGNVIMVPQLNVISYGLGMSVQPVVSPDRRFIRLNLSPQLSAPTFDPNGTINVAVAPPGGFLQGPPGFGTPQPPFTGSEQVQVNVNPLPVSLTIVNTTVNVPDGGTVLLGGFKFLAEERSEYGPPILSSIPYLSRLFRNVGWSRDGSTLMYLVTARIIMVEEEERIFTGLENAIPR